MTVADLKKRLLRLIDAFPTRTLAVLGDMVIDEMIYGHVDRLSREAPVLILKHHKTDILLGGGANTTHNLATLGAETHALGVWGDDHYQQELAAAMSKAGIEIDSMVCDADRPTTTKSRLSGMVKFSITQQMLRLDREERRPLPPTVETLALEKFAALAPQLDGLILADYAIGMVTPALIAAVQTWSRQSGKPFFVDSQQSLKAFAQADILTPNQSEAEQNLGYSLDTLADVCRGGQQLLAETQAKHVLITLGSRGMALFESPSQAWLVPVFNKSEVFDVTGAGDTVIATFALARCCGASLLEAAILGNLAASLVVRHYGSATTTPAELKTALLALDESYLKEALTPLISAA